MFSRPSSSKIASLTLSSFIEEIVIGLVAHVCTTLVKTKGVARIIHLIVEFVQQEHVYEVAACGTK